MPHEYLELKRLINERKLLDKDPTYYVYLIVFILGMLVVNVALLVVTESYWLLLLNAAFLAFVFGQIGLLGHDAGHRQIFRSIRMTEVVSLGTVLLLGLSRSWWIGMHNLHHSHPNQESLDPAFDIPFLAFTEEQANSKRGLFRLIVKYQAYLLIPMTFLEGLGLHLASTQFLFRETLRYPRLEPFLIVVHFVLYFGLLFYLLGAWQGLLFMGIHKALFGLYMTSVFAPNHKGMVTLKKDSEMDCLRQQVLTSRNVKGHLLTDFLYGGLNYQIEHHLFPSIPRRKLREAQKIIKPFCETLQVSYHETSALRSFQEILVDLHRVSGLMGKTHFEPSPE